METPQVRPQWHPKNPEPTMPLHNSERASPGSRSKVISRTRPIRSEEWTYFISQWNDYVEATKVLGKDKTVQLLECCDEQLRKDLTHHAGGTLTGQTEQAVLKAIRALAVTEVALPKHNSSTHCIALHNMRQDRDETSQCLQMGQSDSAENEPAKGQQPT